MDVYLELIGISAIVSIFLLILTAVSSGGAKQFFGKLFGLNFLLGFLLCFLYVKSGGH